MLGRNAVGDFAGLLHAAGVNERAAPGQAFGDDGRARQGGQQALHGLMHLPHVAFIRGKKNALRQLIVLGLAEQVHRHPVRRRRAVGQHEDFARAGNHVDAHLPEHVLFGAGHVGVARAGDLVHARHAGRAVSERGNGLRAANGESAAHARHVRGGQHQRIALAARRGHDHDDFAHARHVRGHGVHQHAGRVGRLAAGHVNAHAVQRRDFLAQQSAVLIAVRSGFAALLFLPLVIAANARGRCIGEISIRTLLLRRNPPLAGKFLPREVALRLAGEGRQKNAAVRSSGGMVSESALAVRRRRFCLGGAPAAAARPSLPHQGPPAIAPKARQRARPARCWRTRRCNWR